MFGLSLFCSSPMKEIYGEMIFFESITNQELSFAGPYPAAVGYARVKSRRMQ